MATMFEKVKRNIAAKSTTRSKPDLALDSSEKIATNGTAEVPKVCPLALQMDDIVYEIITAASAMTKTDMERRESLYTYALVCQTWGRAAQSILFRRVFLQIRPPMLSLLRIISHDTERGRRLAGYIRSLSVKLSRDMEYNDPVSLPMIHPRHLPALLCHMPCLDDLDLTLGGEAISVNILKAIARGPKIRSLTLCSNARAMSQSTQPPLSILYKGNNPWPQLASLTVKNNGYYAMDPLNPQSSPNLNLLQLTLDNTPSESGLSDLCRWLSNDKTRLTHFSVGAANNRFLTHDRIMGLSMLKNVRSLTLGRTSWNEDLFKAIHSLDKLKELRFSSGTSIQRQFPGYLPDTIEHLTIAIPLFAGDQIPIDGTGILTLKRPALLRTCDFINIDVESEPRVIDESMEWSKSYGQRAQDDGVAVTYSDSQKKSTTDVWLRNPFSSANLADYKIPLYIKRDREEFHPSSSQLDILDFEDILGRSTGNRTTDKDRVARPGAASDKTFFASLRKDAVSWTAWIKPANRNRGDPRTLTSL